MGPRPRRPAALLALLGLLIAMTVSTGPQALAQAAVSAPPGCPAALPVDEVAPGMRGTGLTVARGTTPQPFDVTVVDVLRDAIAPGRDMVVVEVDSPDLRRVGGIWGGMSGSPVTIGDRLLGSLSYGFSAGASRLGGITPATQMYEILARGAAPAGPAAIAVPEHVAALARAQGLTAAAAGHMTPLPLPVALSGPNGTAFDRAAAALEAARPGLRAVQGLGGGGAVVGAPPLVAGANLGVSLVTGDVTAMALGTATAVCDPWVLGFGHPVLYDGAVEFRLHGGSVVRVTDDPTFAPFKLVNPGPLAGRIEHDRLAGVAGRLGEGPRGTALTSVVTNLDEDRVVRGRTDVHLRDQADWIAQAHLATNLDVKAFDDPTVSGTAEVRWVVRGTRDDGRSWSLVRTNRHAGDGDLSWAIGLELAEALGLLLRNPYEQVEVTSVDVRVTAGTPYRAYRIDASGVEVAVGGGPLRPVTGQPLELVPGQVVRVRVPLVAYRGGRSSVDATLRVPAGAVGFGELSVVGGADHAGVPPCPDGACATGPDVDTVLQAYAGRPRGDDLVVQLRLTTGEEPPGRAPDAVDAEGRTRLEQVVRGLVSVPVFAGGDAASCGAGATPPFADVSARSTHGPAVACAAAMGLVRGVSADPPRFAPTAPVRRDAAASFLLRSLEAAGVQVPGAPAAPRFTDLAGNVHAEAAERLAAAGILQGVSGDRYGPATAVTRAQLGSLLVAAVTHASGTPPPADVPNPFVDVGGTHADAIAAAAAQGLLAGRADGRFLPDAQTRREQMAAVLLRLVRLLEEPG